MNRILRTASLRAALVYVALVVAGGAVILSLLYLQIAAHLNTRANNSVWRDAARAAYIYEGGVAALAAYIERQDDGVYRLSDGLGAYRGGNLRRFPAPAETRRDAGDWLYFEHEGGQIVARLLQLDADVVLLIGHDRSDTYALQREIIYAFVLALAGLALLGIVGGAVIARRNLRRVDAVNAGLVKFMGGDFTARVASGASGDEWDSLSAQINSALTRIEDLMAAMRQVTDNLAHDLRRPLARLRARLEGMQNEHDTETLQDALGDIDNILSVFAALLSLSRIESGAGQDALADTDIGGLAEEIAGFYAAAFEAAEMLLVFAPPQEKIIACVHKELLSQAIVNLLENALQHGARANTKIYLRVSGAAGRVNIEVADNGAGVAREDLANLTKRFVRLDESRTAQDYAQGYGLGLSLVAAIAKFHNGELVLESDNGFVAKIILPHKSQ